MSLISTQSLTPGSTTREPGRNDPCFCGSGKKYKKCHWLQKIISPYNPIEKGRLLTKLAKLCDKVPGYKKLFDRVVVPILKAWQENNDEVTEFEADLVMEALYFEGKIGRRTLVSLALDSLSPQDSDRKILVDWVRRSLFSYFKVKAVRLGESIEVEDLWGHTEYLGYEQSGSMQIRTGAYIAARLIPCGEAWQFTGLLFPLPHEVGYALERTLASHQGMERLSELQHIRTMAGVKNKGESLSVHAMSYMDTFEELQHLSDKYRQLSSMWEEWRKYENNPVDFPVNHWVDVANTIDQKNDRQFAVELLLRLTQLAINKTVKGPEPGKVEKMLVHAMMAEIKMENLDHLPPSGREKYLAKFTTDWLDTPQPQLNNQTPRAAILAERKQLGNPETKIGYKLTTHFAGGEVMDFYEEALAYQNKGEFWLALEYYAKVEANVTLLPDPFRYYGNVGAVLAYLGCLDPARAYMQRAIALKSDYQQAIDNLALLEDPQVIAKELSGGLSLLWSKTYRNWRNLELHKNDKIPLLLALQIYLDLVKLGEVKVSKKSQVLTKQSFIKLINQIQPQYKVGVTPHFLEQIAYSLKLVKINETTLTTILTKPGQSWELLAPADRWTKLLICWLDAPTLPEHRGELSPLANPSFVVWSKLAGHPDSIWIIKDLITSFIKYYPKTAKLPRNFTTMLVEVYVIPQFTALGLAKIREKKYLSLTSLGRRTVTSMISDSQSQLPLKWMGGHD